MTAIRRIHDLYGRLLIAGSAPFHTVTDISEQGQWTVPVPEPVPRRSRSTLWIACAGALAYNSWPLAFAANPSLAGSALASSFEGRSEPFSWLFILLDCVAGLCMGIVCVRELLPRHGRVRPTGVLVFALLGYGVFGLATAVDAVVPLNCGTTSAQACASQVWPLTPDDFLTGIAVLALFVAALAVVYQLTRKPVALPLSVPVTMTVALIGWGVLGLTVIAWSTSATLAAVDQYAFLTLTSVLAFVVPLGATSSRRLSSTSPAAEDLLPPAEIIETAEPALIESQALNPSQSWPRAMC